MAEVSENLRGPWQAFLVTEDGGQTFTSRTDVPEDVEASIVVLRGGALVAALSGVLADDETVNELDVLYLIGPEYVEDWTVQLPARWEQAQAVAEALNARTAAEAVTL
jgi:hypothetical protein